MQGGIGLGAVLALVFWLGYCWRGPSWTRSLVKTGSVAVLALAAFGQGLPVLGAALAFGAFGDFCLSRVGQTWFLAGMGGFGVAHLLYTFLMFDGVALPGRWPLMIGLGLFGAAMGWALWARAGALRVPVMVYLVIIMAMALTALALDTGPFWPVVTVSALLFVLSDTILAVELFLIPVGHRLSRYLPFLVWPSYWLAQAGLLWGLTFTAIK